MEPAEVKKVLMDLGLSEWESEVYFILIRYGPQTAHDLSRLTRVARPKIYEVATRLRRKGMVIKIPPVATKGTTLKFVATNPEELFESKQEEIKELSKYLAVAYNNPEKARYAKINFYTTKDNARKFLLRMSRKSKSMRLVLNNKDLQHILAYSYDNFIRDIKKKKLGSIKYGTSGINCLIADESFILDLWKTQHIIVEIKSPEVVRTFLQLFL